MFLVNLAGRKYQKTCTSAEILKDWHCGLTSAKLGGRNSCYFCSPKTRIKATKVKQSLPILHFKSRRTALSHVKCVIADKTTTVFHMKQGTSITHVQNIRSAGSGVHDESCHVFLRDRT